MLFMLRFPIVLYYILYDYTLLVFENPLTERTNCFILLRIAYFIPFFCSIWQYRSPLRIYPRRDRVPPPPTPRPV